MCMHRRGATGATYNDRVPVSAVEWDKDEEKRRTEQPAQEAQRRVEAELPGGGQRGEDQWGGSSEAEEGARIAKVARWRV